MSFGPKLGPDFQVVIGLYFFLLQLRIFYLFSFFLPVCELRYYYYFFFFANVKVILHLRDVHHLSVTYFLYIFALIFFFFI